MFSGKESRELRREEPTVRVLFEAIWSCALRFATLERGRADMKDTLLMLTGAALLFTGVLAIVAIAQVSSSSAAAPSMVDVAQRLYANAKPKSFDAKCTGKGAKLEVEGDRHRCTRPDGASIVRFAGDDATQVTVYRKGLRKGELGKIKGKLGAPSSVQTLGAVKMHFWFTKEATVSLGFQSSSQSQSTLVSYRAP